MKKKKKKLQSCRLSMEPVYEKLSWPGLRAKDHLSRVVTRAVKEDKEVKERDLWAEKQIARILENVPPRTALRLFLLGMRRKRRPLRRASNGLLKLLPD
jgi:hypothetical protein